MTPGYPTCEISQRPRWISFYLGLGVNAAGVLLLVALDPHLRTGALPESVVVSHYVALIAPSPRPSPASTLTVPVATRTVKVEHPQLAPFPPRTEPPQAQKVEIAKALPAPEVVAKVATPKQVMPAPPTPIKTHVFDSEKSDSAVVHEPAWKVQTGGFGDPNGLAGQGDPQRQTVTATNVGSFDLPAGAGKGNGTRGSQGTTGRIRTSGFGDSAPEPIVEARKIDVAASGFGDVVAKTRTDSQPAPLKLQIQPVQILFKPRPTYTPEARSRGVQGEVLLDVVFEASGALRVNRIVKGLGYGLDDMALDAAKKIQFRPALRDGQPYDCAALVHIRFELAD